MFSNSIAPHIVAASLKALELLTASTELRDKLEENTKYFRAALTDRGVSERPIPVFGQRDGVVSCRLIRNQINAGAVKRGVPLTTLEKEALDFLDEQTRRPDLRLHFEQRADEIVEIGSYRGRSAIVLSLAAPGRSCGYWYPWPWPSFPAPL